MNDQRPQPAPQVVVPIGADTDDSEYVLADGEENLYENWHHDRPPRNTFIWKNGDMLSACPPDQPPFDLNNFYQAQAVAGPQPQPDSGSDSESDTQPRPDFLSRCHFILNLTPFSQSRFFE
jgi:hypothetical protein